MFVQTCRGTLGVRVEPGRAASRRFASSFDILRECVKTTRMSAAIQPL